MAEKKCIKIFSYPDDTAFDKVVSIAGQLYKQKSKEDLEVLLRKTPIKLNVSDKVFNKLYEILVKLGCQISDCSVKTITEVIDGKTDEKNKDFSEQNSEKEKLYGNINNQNIDKQAEESSVSEEDVKKSEETEENKPESNSPIGEQEDKDDLEAPEENDDKDKFLYFDNWVEHGFFQSLSSSFTGIFMHPDDFFEQMGKVRWYNSLLFYIIFSIIPMGSSFAFAKQFLSFMGSYGDGMLSFSMMITSFLSLIFLFFFEVINIHFSVIIFGKGKGIGKTMQIVSYLSVVKIFNVVPIFGSILSMYLYVVYLATSLVKAHKFSVAKGVAASLLPIVMMIFFVIFVIFFIIFFLGGTNAQTIINLFSSYHI